MTKSMEKIVALCKRRGIIFQNSEIYGGQNGFWDYGPLGTLLKRNVRDAWWNDMISNHDEYSVPPGAPESFSMVGIESSIIMHPQVWKCSGHYDLFHDFMVDCRECKSRFRVDHVTVVVSLNAANNAPIACETFVKTDDVSGISKKQEKRLEKAETNAQNAAGAPLEIIRKQLPLNSYLASVQNYDALPEEAEPRCPNPNCHTGGRLTSPREFNLMFKTTIGALSGEEGTAFLRPETAQGMFVNFKNVVDSSRVRIPFGIAQIGKSFRNEITPRNFIFRSREFEQMEMEFFCHPSQSMAWYQYWRDRRFAWYKNLGISESNLILREHTADEMAHYSVGTADVEYAFPFLNPGEYGELEGIAHRGDFDLRSHMEGKLIREGGQLVVEKTPDGQPKYKGSGKDLKYFNDETRERYVPHVVEPAAGADRATLAFLCEAYHEDQQPDEKGEMQERVLLKFHPKLAPIKVAVFPLIKKAGMPEKALEIYRELKSAGVSAFFDQQGAVGRRYRRQDEIGTPYCVTVDGETEKDNTVTIRDRDSTEQIRLSAKEVVQHVLDRLRG